MTIPRGKEKKRKKLAILQTNLGCSVNRLSFTEDSVHFNSVRTTFVAHDMLVRSNIFKENFC